VDPGEKGAILGTGGPGPPERGKGRQLASDREEKGCSNMATGTERTRHCFKRRLCTE
jgi:hypothetical protein